MEDALKFVWAYLLTHGKLTNGKWCQYRGGWEDHELRWIDREKMRELMSDIRETALEVGIDWDKTTVPTVSNESEFNDTESPNSDRKGTLGTLVLNNGDTYLVGSGDDDAASLVRTAQKLMEGKSEVQKLAERL